MLLKDFLFSYKNILLECLRKKKFFTFLRRLVNLPYKFLANLFKSMSGVGLYPSQFDIAV